MKIIDLLNKIANGEEIPKKVKYVGVIFENKNGDLLNSNYCSLFEHRSNDCEKLLPMLNDEVEILEEKKIPEKLKMKKTINGSFEGNPTYIYKYNEDEIGDTINQLIDYFKSKGE